MNTVYMFPGQGSQKKGMGNELFAKHKELIAKCDEILKYSIKKLCLEDPDEKLNNTRYSQVAIYIVNTMYYREMLQEGKKPDFVIGHSLGEYNALQAAGVFDFETGLRLVQKRGEIMSKPIDGGMAAIIGSNSENLVPILIKENNLENIDIANYNSPSQVVISGLKEEILKSKHIFESAKLKYFPLNVSGAFHSRQMKNCSYEFEDFLEKSTFKAFEIPIISNLTARPYEFSDIKHNLAAHLVNPVRWTESIRYLLSKECENFIEVGNSTILNSLIERIKKEATPLIFEDSNKEDKHYIFLNNIKTMEKQENLLEIIKAKDLGAITYKKAYSLKYAYSAGSMYKGVSSAKMVIALAKSGFMSYFGTGGLSLERIKDEILVMQKELNNKYSFGMNLIYDMYEPEKENKLVDLYLKMGVHNIEASAYMQISAALVKFRIKGLRKGDNGSVISSHRIQAKVSRPEIATLFLSPSPQKLIDSLLSTNDITEEQAEMAKYVPVATEVCVEADSGGHTDRGIITNILPTICRLRNQMSNTYDYKEYINIGAAGGIGTPEAAAAVFTMGADYIQTGSINQCTVEAGISDSVKAILECINIQDTDYAPAGDMFELGAKVQVLKKSVLFPARANKLYELYRQYNSIDEINPKLIEQIEKTYFKKSIDEIYQSCKLYYSDNEIIKAEKNPKLKMALIFKWYFGNSSNAALKGDEENRVNYQVYCGPALGAFNQWIKGTKFENWQNRHVDEIAIKLMNETAAFLSNNILNIVKGIW